MSGGRIAALVLAAGYSSRMGEFKPLLPVGNVPAIERVVNSFLAAGIKDVRVVVGYRAAEIIPVLQRLGVCYLVNKDYDRGMFSSVQTGVSSLEADVDAFFLLPVDYPLISPGIISRLLQVYREQRPLLLYPCHEGLRGHPPLLSLRLKEKIMAWQAEKGGLQGLLAQYTEQAVEVEVNDQGILLDMDTPEDYRRMLALAGQNLLPTAAECYRILAQQQVPAKVIAHSRQVAKVALKLACALNRRGFNLNGQLVAAGGLLHDLAKGHSDHAGVGAAMLRQLGYPQVAEIVAVHTDINLGANSVLNEAAIVYLADKLVKGENVVTLVDRFCPFLAKFAGDATVCAVILGRFANAVIIKERIEQALGQRVEQILSSETAEGGVEWDSV